MTSAWDSRKIDQELMIPIYEDLGTQALVREINDYLVSKQKSPEEMLTMLRILKQHYEEAEPSKFGKPGKWDFSDVCQEAATIIYEYFKDNGEPGYGRHLSAIVKRGMVWTLDGGEAWDAFDALASSDVDRALLPLTKWLSNLSDFRQCAHNMRKKKPRKVEAQ